MKIYQGDLPYDRWHLNQVCIVMHALSKLMPNVVQWPDARKQICSSQIFKNRSGINGVIGAVDGCHIPIKQPAGNAHDYYNRKQFHSIILQGTCDEKCKFIDVFIGMPGRLHDARVFKSSPLYRRIMNENDGLCRPHQHLLGDSAYPLLMNLMTPFRDNGHLNAQQTLYNVRLSSIRSVIERAFGRLKGKFRRLKYLDVSDIELACHIIAAACVLHNFIISNGDNCEEEDEEDVFQNVIEDIVVENSTVTSESKEKRTEIMNNL